MIRLLLSLFLVALSVHALSDSEILKRADAFMQTNSKSDQFRAYNDYKNLYLRAIMSDDTNLRVSSLQGIVKSGNKLHIDVSQYSDELLNMKPDTSFNAPTSKNFDTTNEDIQIQSSHKLESIRWRDERLILIFDKKLASNQINYFTLHDKKENKYKYVFDIHASMLTKSENLRKEGISRIKLAQFNPNTLRLVFENSDKLNLHFKQEHNKLIINIELPESAIIPKEAIKSEATPSKVSKRDKTIMIDAGHGGKDPGAVGYRKYREKIVVLDIAKRLKTILKSRGYKVYMSRENDKFIKLSNRTEHANKKDADIFISIHANAVEESKAQQAKGVECYFLSPSRSEKAELIAEKENSADMSDMNKYGKQSFLNFLNHHKILASNKLAIDVQRGMLASLTSSYTDITDGGVREGPFWVLVGAQMPSVLVEVGFISHPMEAKRLVSTQYQKRLALGIADGIERYFANN
ncbi:MAG: N-acetylmuramoyl-L-alanine amidase [Epsilonproteobacteria bacterium]|nr:N-acetylmuramoyl-L-alanine amidase [Campylobacterota bacterium]OIO17677.1 MAG: N-acetylmuramoyl-L-alanine amidase [Helicobacteraceae bacterium CG1_02_36_14]PIP09669.1 MAG: N-acetylmuramoyl-L-alanine amidase [Sulfurimonas sp. CG23_combo_of_CG06-09_8_20_14_all_36_33]PIS26214.1 MAG: N-acetylmuramoyl-L-alanine amidase [Sulfurimonas sp. CG08_land_8_20_14_0_20_36_33]PIU34298.1 MAG: N-acetylmuramoyl-L-alanine amidase [Sulfurimonas sp. CG07_land_8_20_14_0_80_36_56]PIV02596.1 MAG: N-acetylmuramoyl-L